MKTLAKGILSAIALLLLLNNSSFAIEGLQVSVQSSNAVVSWPSADSETYIVQYRTNLNAVSSWLTLTDFLSAATGTNITSFVHSNSVQYPPIIPGTTNGGGSIDPNQTNSSSSSSGTNSFPSTAGFYRVVRDGAHIYGLTNNSTLSGEVQMPIEISVDSTDNIESVTFFNSADDSPVIGASAYVNDAGTWVFDWNTVMVENGSNNIYAEVDFTTDDPVSSANLPVSLNVNNTISFPNYFTSIFGSQMWIYAETIPDASFQIDIYDENTNYLGTFADFADDSGVISFLWDLTDGSGNTFDSTNFSGVFTVTTSSPSIRFNTQLTGGISTNTPSFHKLVQKSFIKSKGIHANDTGSSSSATNHWALETAWSGLGGFVVAYAPLTDPAIDPNTSFKESLMMLGGSDGNEIGVIGSLDGNDFHGHLSPGNVPQTSAFEMGNLTNKTNLLGYLADFTYRNFYFFGHGNPTVISAYNGSGVAINANTIQKTLGNFLTTSKPENFHPYRFVFIDGCENGKGKFCEAFGIPAQTVNNAFFATGGVRSRAYLGFKNDIAFNTAQWDWRSIMLGGFFEDWLANAPLQSCVNNAVSAIHSSGFQPMDSSWVIYGATDLQKNSP